MAAFKKARELDVPGIELDVHACASGELVVVHDDTFKRTAPWGENGNGRDIEDLSLFEIRHIDVGSFWDPAFSKERPLLLEEVLEEFCPDRYIDIELKSRKIKNDPLPRLVAKKLNDLGERVQSSVTISSFNPFCLAAFKRFCPLIPTAVIWSADPEVPLILRRGLGRFIARCDYAKPAYRQVSPAFHFRITRIEGRPLIPWTIDDPALVRRMVELGCQGIITNRPQDMGRINALRP
jgi:glycerophosphoryl diester phosphodiesterase